MARAPGPIMKTSCKAFKSMCKKCDQVGHYTSACKKPSDKKTKEDEVSATANSVQIMQSNMGTITIKLCQFKMSGNEIEYNKAIRRKLQTRPNVRFSNEEFHQLSNEFVVQKPILSPTIQVNIKLDIKAYKTHSPPLKIMMTRESVKTLTTTTTINPFLMAPTADTGHR